MAQATTRRASSARARARKIRVVGRYTQHGQEDAQQRQSSDGHGRPPTAGQRVRIDRQRASRNARPRSATRSKPSTNGVAGTLSGVGNTVGSAVGKVGDSVGKVGDSVGTAAQKAKVPAIVGTAAAAGLAGGVALGRACLAAQGRPASRSGAR